ncbi:hypothetical protein BMF94_3726 [Rhodotorula taiwanensis]|uniref:Cation efflux protein transmembrane domain-containing protein n=1 Tax=Rhodotorula taiwanensis TaxID=741276 RepID=A0A2S5B9D9_9BASI|nr:hypothetical protein BMF94_3726 [Rhodotorula taiwanensis]
MSRGGYAEAYDPRVSGRVSLSQFDQSIASSLPADLLLALAGSKLAVAFTLHATREWLFARGYSPWTCTAAVLAAGGAFLSLWERSWEASRTPRRKQTRRPLLPLSLSFFLETLFALLCVDRIGATKFLLLASFSSLWARGFPLATLAGRKASDRSNAFILTTALIAAAYFLETLIAAWAFGGAIVRHAFGSSTSVTNSDEAVSWSTAILISTLTGAAWHVVDPLLTRSLLSHFPPIKIVRPGWPIAALVTFAAGRLAFAHAIGGTEVVLAVVGWKVVGHMVATDPRAPVVSAGSVTTGSTAPDASFVARCECFYRHARATIKVILDSPESRRIFLFLCINLAFMFVQMAYGVWTNSLGLISDSIHMFFDCLALGVGLFASVMATWPSNNVYTYGYTRMETLSGFANAVFLCLISIFIVFEAIQRLVDPPEISTNQLLTVSSVGLAVNLVGMAATGGHHGHSHGGGGGGGGSGHAHGHGHGHSQTPVRSNSTPFLTMSEQKDEMFSNGHANGHSHASHARSPSTPTHQRSRSYAASPILSPSPHAKHARSGSMAVLSTPQSAHDHTHTSNGLHSHESFTPEANACGHGHSHGHAHDHGDVIDRDEDEDDCEGEAGHGGHSHNMKGVFLHVLADTLGSVGVIISTLLIERYGWTGFDPLASIFIAVMIFASVVPLIADSGRILILDMGPEREEEVKKALVEVSRLEGVASFTKPRFWLLDSSTMVGSIAIQLAPASSAYDSHGQPSRHYASFEKTKARVRRTLKRHVAGLEHLSIQMEPTGGFASDG